MSNLVRFGVSLEDDLLNKFDRHIKERKYTNRSEAVRDLIREELVKKRCWISSTIITTAFSRLSIFILIITIALKLL